jgi:exopolysaccharide biosynthesis polyprenyl glycosylphosphotransferase
MTTTQRIEPLAERAAESIEPAPAGERELSIYITPDVALHQAKAETARRHLLRQVARNLLIASGDLAAAAAAALVVRVAVEWLGAWTGPVQMPFGSAAEFSLAVIFALLLTGNYQRSIPPHSTLHLLMGSALGALVVCWSNLWSAPTLGALPVAVALAVVATAFLSSMRVALQYVMTTLLPDEPLMTPALVVSPTDSTIDFALCAAAGYRVIGTVNVDAWNIESRVQELARAIRRARAESVLVLGDLRNSLFARVLEISLRAGCEVLTTPPGFGVPGVRSSIARRGAYGLIRIGAPSLQTPQFVAKRLMDIVGSVAALVVTAPLWLVIAVLIRLDSPGPVFFRQERVGIGGRRFRMLKFRTMRCGADDEKESVAHLNVSGDPRLFKIPNDPRISRVGHFLRRWSLDELPQFLNVIGGSMSLVGPRPFFERDFAAYEAHHFRRLGAKPGITGMWQVYGRSSVLDFEEVVRLDTEYIDRWSLWLDLKILSKTLPAVVGRTGAY